MSEDEFAKCQYLLNDPKKEVPLLGFNSYERAAMAVHNYYEKKYFGRTFEVCD